MDAHTLLRQIKRLAVSERTMHTSKEAGIQELRERIKRGETASDRITDFVIVAHEYPWGRMIQTYRDIENRLQQHVGEFILVVVRVKKRIPMNGELADFTSPVAEYALMGVLESDHLMLPPISEVGLKSIAIPSGKKYVQMIDFAVSSFKVCNCDIGANFLGVPVHFASLDKELLLESRWGSQLRRCDPLPKALELYVGDQEVLRYFSREYDKRKDMLCREDVPEVYEAMTKGLDREMGFFKDFLPEP